MADNESLPFHTDIPAVPAQAIIQPDSKCNGCSLVGSTGHKTCESFRLQNNPAVNDNQIIFGDKIMAIQGQVSRKSFDANGIVASANDFWYRWNAPFEKAINFAYFTTYRIVSASGKNITLEALGEADAREMLESTFRQRETVLNYYWIHGFSTVKSPSPGSNGDMVTFEYPSAGYNKLNCKIEKIISASATQITLQLDKDVSIVTNVVLYDPDTETEPDDLYARIYTYGRCGEDWNYVVPANYFAGRRKQKIVEADALTGDKIWILEEDVICPPESVDPLQSPNFVMEGWNGTHWEPINETASRLHIKRSEASYAVGTTVPTGSIKDNPTTDLTASYERFRATYYVEANLERDADCSIRGFAQCYNSVRDYTNSVQNYNSVGHDVDDDGNSWFCREAVQEEYEYHDTYNRYTQEQVPPGVGDSIPDSVTTTTVNVSGIANYSHNCIQYNYCNGFVDSLTKLGDNQAPFTVQDKLSPILKEVLFAADMKIQQAYLLAQHSIIDRVKHSSIFYANGYYSRLNTRDGWYPRVSFRGNGALAKPYQDGSGNYYYTDGDGNQHLTPFTGVEVGFSAYHWEDESYDYLREATFPLLGTDFTTKPDEINPSANIESNLLQMLAGSVERNTGQMVNDRGLGNTSIAIPSQDIICANIDLSESGVHRSSQATFEKPSGQNATLAITRLIHPTNDERSIGSRTIHSASLVSGNVWYVELENEYQTFSQLDLGDLGEIGDTYQKTFTAKVSGVYPIKPYEPYAIDAPDTEDLTTGSRNAGLARGDCADVNGKRFVVTDCKPSYGSAATTAGERQETAKAYTYGFWEANLPDAEQYPINVLTVTNATDGVPMVVRTDEITKPDLAVNECWFDGNARIWFSSLNDGDFITIDCEDSEEVAFSGWISVEKNKTHNLNLDYSDWTSAGTKVITIGAETMTVIVGGTDAVDAGEVRINELSGSGKLQATFNIDDGGNDVELKIVLTFPEQAAEAGDHWNFIGKDYLTYCLKRDAVWIIDDQNFFASGNRVGETISFYQSSSVFVPKTSVSLEWTTVESDNWQPIPSEFILSASGGSGEIIIAKEWFDQFDALPEVYGYGYGYESTDSTDFFDVYDTEEDGAYGYGYGITIPETLAATICIKAKAISLFDHRGNIPGSLLNKIELLADSQNWFWTSMGSGTGNYAKSKGFDQINGFTKLDNGHPLCGYGPSQDNGTGGPWESAGGNFFYRYTFVSAGPEAGVGMGIEASSFGEPEIIKNLPDGCEILDAYAEIYCNGLTRTMTTSTFYASCEEEPDERNGTTYNTSLSGVSFTVIGFTSKNNFEPIGQSISSGTPQQQNVVNVKDIIQAMYDNRSSGTYPYGYGLIASVGDFTSLEAAMPDLPEEVEGFYCEGHECYGYSYYYCPTTFSDSISWSNISFGQVVIKVKYPDNYFTTGAGGIVQPHFPSFKELT